MSCKAGLDKIAFVGLAAKGVSAVGGAVMKRGFMNNVNTIMNINQAAQSANAAGSKFKQARYGLPLRPPVA